MADSGIESGSITSPHETVSEDSSNDLNDPNESPIQKKNDGISTVYKTLSSSAHVFQNESGLTKNETKFEQRGHISELDNSREEDDIQSQFKVCATFKLGPSSVSLESENTQKSEDQLTQEIIFQSWKKPNITVEVSRKILGFLVSLRLFSVSKNKNFRFN